MENTEKIPRKITVIGAGTMGITLARLYRQQQYEVTIWNRTTSKIAPLAGEGIRAEEDLVKALEANPIVLVCVLDYPATADLLSTPGAWAALQSKTLVQLSTGSPEEAATLGDQVAGAGASYLDAALQVAPEQIGKPDTTILLSGEEAIFQQWETTLCVMGANLKYLGARVSLAAAMDLATLSTVYGSFIGMLQGVSICEAAGFNIAAYGDLIAEIMPGFIPFLQHEAHVIQSGDFRISQSPLAISVGATQRIWQAAKAYGINSSFAEMAAGLLSEAAPAGYGKEELAAIIKVLRKKEAKNKPDEKLK